MEDAYQQTLARWPQNSAARIEQKNGRDVLVLTTLDNLDEPASLVTLRDRVAALLPPVDLPEVLLEIHQRIGFADEFTQLLSELRSKLLRQRTFLTTNPSSNPAPGADSRSTYPNRWHGENCGHLGIPMNPLNGSFRSIGCQTPKSGAFVF